MAGREAASSFSNVIGALCPMGLGEAFRRSHCLSPDFERASPGSGTNVYLGSLRQESQLKPLTSKLSVGFSGSDSRGRLSSDGPVRDRSRRPESGSHGCLWIARCCTCSLGGLQGTSAR
jgi:hypothetical protein